MDQEVEVYGIDDTGIFPGLIATMEHCSTAQALRVHGWTSRGSQSCAFRANSLRG